jgi:hypothetical protein
MPGKRVQIDDATWHALAQLAKDRVQDFQELADEAFADLLAKHGRPRLTNAFSKKFENHCHALALYFFWYNWTRQHKAHRLSPAMAAGLTDKLWSMTDLASIIDDVQPKPSKRGPYKKRAAVAA